MAISPDDAYAKALPSVSEIDKLVSIIDSQIVRSIQTGQRIIIGYLRFGNDHVTREIVVKRYRNAGWTVTFHDDQRDGATYELTKHEVTPDIRDSRGGNYEH